MDTDTPIVIPISRLARRLRAPLRWLRAEAAAGRIPHIDAGGQILCDPAAVEAELRRRASASPRRKGARHAR